MNSVSEAEGNPTSICLNPTPTRSSNISSFSSTLMGTGRDWLPSRRSTEHQMGASVIARSGHCRSVRPTSGKSRYFRMFWVFMVQFVGVDLLSEPWQAHWTQFAPKTGKQKLDQYTYEPGLASESQHGKGRCRGPIAHRPDNSHGPGPPVEGKGLLPPTPSRGNQAPGFPAEGWENSRFHHLSPCRTARHAVA